MHLWNGTEKTDVLQEPNSWKRNVETINFQTTELVPDFICFFELLAAYSSHQRLSNCKK